ncbi:MAG: hypothetical protein IT210_17685 [Armatimonadetes bacterium]|nr:hypothetical protein [Armatimonadota bacterium]
MEATPGIAKDAPARLPTPPVLRVQPEQVEGVREPLQGYGQGDAPTFQRREQRAWGLQSRRGRLKTTAHYVTQPMARR